MQVKVSKLLFRENYLILLRNFCTEINKHAKEVFCGLYIILFNFRKTCNYMNCMITEIGKDGKMETMSHSDFKCLIGKSLTENVSLVSCGMETYI